MVSLAEGWRVLVAAPATVLALSVLLVGCHAGVPPSLRQACLAEDAAGATRLLDGYPVEMLDRAYHGPTGKVSQLLL